MSKKERLFTLFNDYFDKIFVITLKKNKDRHALVQETLEGLDYDFFYGIDGSQLELNQLEKDGIYHPHLTRLMKKRIGRHPSHLPSARIGCALSHVGVYKEMLKKNYQKILILEDDPLLNIKNVDAFKTALNELPEDWELLYLGHQGANSNPSVLLKFQVKLLRLFAIMIRRFDRLKRIDPDVIRRWFARPYSEHLELSGSHFGAYAYAITRNGAEKVLNFQTPVVQESDNLLSELCSYGWIKAFNLKEKIFLVNRELPSTINQ